MSITYLLLPFGYFYQKSSGKDEQTWMLFLKQSSQKKSLQVNSKLDFVKKCSWTWVALRNSLTTQLCFKSFFITYLTHKRANCHQNQNKMLAYHFFTWLYCNLLLAFWLKRISMLAGQCLWEGVKEIKFASLFLALI